MHRIASGESFSPTTVMGAMVSGFASFISHQGAEANDIFERSAINPEALNNPNQPISLPAFLKAVDTAASLTGNDNFGLWLGNQYRPEYLGLWGYIGLSSATLGEALITLSRYFPNFQSRSFLNINYSKSEVRVEYGLLDGSIVSRRHDAEISLGCVFNIIRRALGEQWTPSEVHFSHGRPDYWQEHQKAFGTNVRFEQRSNAIIMNPSYLSRAMPGADPQLLLLAKQGLNTLRIESAVRLSVSDRVRSNIIERFHGEVPRIHQIADHLEIPVWTLTRQLKEEGVTFSSLVDSVRKELAHHYLEKTTISVSKLAELLGYTETSSFTHAFNRWAGASPNRWRDKMREVHS